MEEYYDPFEEAETFCDICHESCQERGDRTTHEADLTTFCSCCIRWYEECNERASRTVDLWGLEQLDLIPGELMRLEERRGWIGFAGAEYIMHIARAVEENGHTGTLAIRLGEGSASVDLDYFGRALSEALGDLDPPEGYCPLDSS